MYRLVTVYRPTPFLCHIQAIHILNVGRVGRRRVACDTESGKSDIPDDQMVLIGIGYRIYNRTT